MATSQHTFQQGNTHSNKVIALVGLDAHAHGPSRCTLAQGSPLTDLQQVGVSTLVYQSLSIGSANRHCAEYFSAFQYESRVLEHVNVNGEYFSESAPGPLPLSRMALGPG
jgi:hypothetical protein